MKRKKSIRFWRRLSIRQKLIFSNILLFGMCFAILIMSSFRKTEDILTAQIERQLGEEQRILTANVTQLLDSVQQLSASIVEDRTLRALFDAMKGKTYNQVLDEFYQLKYRFENFEKQFSLVLYISDEYPVSENQGYFRSMSEVRDQEWYETVMESNGSIYWRVQQNEATGKPVIRGLRVLRNQWLTESVGVLAVDITEEEIKAQLGQETREGRLTASMLLDAEQTRLGSNTDSGTEAFIRSNILGSLPKDAGSGLVRVRNTENDTWAIGTKIIPQSWMLVSVVPYDSVVEPIRILRNYHILFAALILVVSVVFSIFSLNRITGRIKRLSEKMVRIENDHFEPLLELSYRDEFFMIEYQYNKMCIRIKSLIDEVYKVQLKKKEAELRTLQAQINPHFLYNALDTINWMAVEYGAYDVSRLAGALGRFARLSLSKGRDIIPLEDELEICMLYLEVQKVRFGENLRVETDVSPDVRKAEAMKLLLQPLVENSIKHGFQSDKMRSGVICIRGWAQDARVCVEVEDNGIGAPEQLDLPVDEPDWEKFGYGLRNIRDRMSVYYKTDFVLSIRGKPEKGTVVHLEWPLKMTALPDGEEKEE